MRAGPTSKLSVEMSRTFGEGNNRPAPFRQNASIFKYRLERFQKGTRTLVDLVFIDAPHLIEDYVEPDGGNAGLRGWWFSSEAACPYTQQAFEKSVKTVEQACKLQGPFDGVLGFSQGAAFTAILLAMQSLGSELLTRISIALQA